MPVYEYLCGTCGNDFEIKQSFSEAALTVCPRCGNKIHRVPQAAGVVFKGSGWYITDSKGKQNLAASGEKKASDNGDSSSAPAASTESNSSAGNDSSDSAKSDSAKSDSKESSTPAVAAATSDPKPAAKSA